MPERRGSRLAERMKAKLDELEAEKARAIAERERRLAAARAARDALFEDLEAFARVIDHIASARQGEALVLRRGDRYLHLEPMGDGDRVRVTYAGSEGEEHRLYREADLGDRWVWAFTRKRKGEERLPLFDVGLEELLVLSLDLPRVSEVDDDPIVERPTRNPAPARDPFAAFATPDPKPEPPADLPAPSAPTKRSL